MANREILFRDLGLLDYKVCWDYQEELFHKIIACKTTNCSLPDENKILTENHLLFVEHPHVFTLGKSGDEKNLLIGAKELEKEQASYYKINRGGDITYHGPGQLVVYPILDLDHFFTDIHKYLRLLEETIIQVLNDYGIKADRSKGETGVWLDPEVPGKARKICAMGVRCSRWVTMHGLAFNVNSDLSYFGHIVPCGIQNKDVTSLQKELGREVDMTEVKEKFKFYFSELFDARLLELSKSPQ